MTDRRRHGKQWERRAESFLRQKGLKLLQRNYLARCGEIDLILLQGAVLVFAEVRFRESDTHGSGAESVTRVKQQRIIRTAAHFLQRHPRHRNRHCRFDVLSIGTRRGEPVIDWIQNAFYA